MKTIMFSSKWKYIGGGAYGEYFRMSTKKGIKILGFNRVLDIAVQNARKELKLIKKAFKSKYSPKAYEVVKVNRGGIMYVGIIMQHLDATRVSNLNYDTILAFQNSVNDTIDNFVREQLRKVGIHHGDLHTGNMLAKIKNGKISTVYAIDFSPSCIGIIKKV